MNMDATVKAPLDYCYVILEQHFKPDHNYTIYTILDNQRNKLFQMSAHDVYNNDQLLPNFGPSDIRNICYSVFIEDERAITHNSLKQTKDT